MPLRITVELIPHGNEGAKTSVAIIDVENDGTGTHGTGNYTIRAQGACSVEGEPTGWDSWAGFPKRMTNFDRRKPYIDLAKAVMELV